MIKLTRVTDGNTIYVARGAIAIVQPPPDHARNTGAVLLIAGQLVAVSESVEAVVNMVEQT